MLERPTPPLSEDRVDDEVRWGALMMMFAWLVAVMVFVLVALHVD